MGRQEYRWKTVEGRDSRWRREELDGYRAKGEMKRKPIYFPASLLLFVTSVMLYLIELFLPLESGTVSPFIQTLRQ
jgi:hypothetical protein